MLTLSQRYELFKPEPVLCRLGAWIISIVRERIWRLNRLRIEAFFVVEVRFFLAIFASSADIAESIFEICMCIYLHLYVCMCVCVQTDRQTP